MTVTNGTGFADLIRWRLGNKFAATATAAAAL
jgi:hypothetical protein